MSRIGSLMAGHRGSQRGAVTLIVTLLILVAMTLGLLALIGTSSMETRMAANDQRSRQAMQRAQAGIDYLLAGLATTNINRGYLCETAANTRATHGFVIDYRLPTGQTCQAIPFEILTKLDAIRSWGYSDDGESVRVIESTLDLTTPWNFGTPAGTLTGGAGKAAVVTKLDALFQGQGEAARCNLSGSYLCADLARPGNVGGLIDGTLVRAGGNVDLKGGVPMGAGNVSANDTGIQGLTTDQLFADFFSNNKTKAEFIASAYQFTQGGGNSNLGNAGNNQLIYVTGDLDLNGGTLGSENKPVALYVKGDLKNVGNSTIWGTVYVEGKADFSRGTTKILGSLVAEGQVDMRGNAAVYYNDGLRPDPKTVDPAGLVATATAKDSTVRIGSWRELSLSAADAPKP